MPPAFALTTSQKKKLNRHLELLQTWGKVFNLTAIKNPEEMWSKHVEDVLSVAPFIQGYSILDVGSGAGFPGIPLAVIFPDKQFTLLDSNGKKTRFLFQVKVELELANVHIINQRVEAFQVEQPFDHIICRAFSELEKFHVSCLHLAGPATLFMAMKGRLDSAELAKLGLLARKLQVINLVSLCGERKLLTWKL